MPRDSRSGPTDPCRAHRTAPAAETLEARRMLSASVRLLGDGELLIRGTGSADVIRVATRVPVTGQPPGLNDPWLLAVQIDSEPMQHFTLRQDGRVVVRAGGGDDLIDLAVATYTPEPDPEPVVFNPVGARAVLAGGDGDDRIFAGGGSQLLLGGRGGDDLRGGIGTQRLFGGDGVDRIDGGHGADVIFGGRHRDRLVHELGQDRLRRHELDEVEVLPADTNGRPVPQPGTETVVGRAVVVINGREHRGDVVFRRSLVTSTAPDAPPYPFYNDGLGVRLPGLRVSAGDTVSFRLTLGDGQRFVIEPDTASSVGIILTADVPGGSASVQRFESDANITFTAGQNVRSPDPGSGRYAEYTTDPVSGRVITINVVESGNLAGGMLVDPTRQGSLAGFEGSFTAPPGIPTTTFDRVELGISAIRAAENPPPALLYLSGPVIS